MKSNRISFPFPCLPLPTSTTILSAGSGTRSHFKLRDDIPMTVLFDTGWELRNPDPRWMPSPQRNYVDLGAFSSIPIIYLFTVGLFVTASHKLISNCKLHILCRTTH